MGTETKKISFGFNKLSKKSNLIVKKPVEEKKLELVECLEGQSIKIKDAVEEVFVPLVIPINKSQKNLLDRIKEARSKQKESKEEKKEEVDDRPDSDLTIDELAARELIREAKNRLAQTTEENKVFVLPVKDNNDKEPTLDDYENIPIGDFGKAMLRGMGWKEDTANSNKTAEPELRPKGLGLGASKLVKAQKQKEAVDKDGNELILKKGTFAKIIAGSHRGNYCEVQGLDDEACRVIVRTSLKGEILTLNEFLVVPVTKDEYAKGSKIINNAKYEEYKQISDKKIETIRSNERRSEQEHKNRDKRHAHSGDKDDYVKKEKHNRRDKSSRRDYSSDSDDSCDRKSGEGGRDRSPHRSKSSSESDRDRSTRKHKKGKSKHRERSRSASEEDSHRKSKKKSSKSKNHSKSSSSETEYRKKKTKKTKCKSRHRRSSSTDSDRERRRSDRKGKR